MTSIYCIYTRALLTRVNHLRYVKNTCVHDALHMRPYHMVSFVFIKKKFFSPTAFTQSHRLLLPDIFSWFIHQISHKKTLDKNKQKQTLLLIFINTITNYRRERERDNGFFDWWHQQIHVRPKAIISFHFL